MIKTLKFGEKEVHFSTSFAWCFNYKSQFGQDPARAFIPVIKKLGSIPSSETAFAIFEEIGIVGVAQIAWSMAKLCDKNIPDPITWIESFGDGFETLDIVTELIPDAITSCFASKNSETPSQKELETAPEAENPEKNPASN